MMSQLDDVSKAPRRVPGPEQSLSKHQILEIAEFGVSEDFTSPESIASWDIDSIKLNLKWLLMVLLTCKTYIWRTLKENRTGSQLSILMGMQAGNLMVLFMGTALYAIPCYHLTHA